MNILAALLLTAAVLTPAPRGSAQARPADGRVTFTLEGLDHNRGQVKCAIFVEKHWLDHGFARVFVKPRDGKARCVFPAVPHGRYGIASFHDEDMNGEMTRFLGIPIEDYAFSVVKPPILSAPDFQDAAFRHHSPETRLKASVGRRTKRWRHKSTRRRR